MESIIQRIFTFLIITLLFTGTTVITANARAASEQEEGDVASTRLSLPVKVFR